MKSTYQLIDSGHFRKLEQVGPYRLIRPALGAVWSPRLGKAQWQDVDGEFIRNSSGKGYWNLKNEVAKKWAIEIGSLRFVIQLTDFGHLGLFAEQSNNWQTLENLILKWTADGSEIRALNLFAYTGGSSMACAKGGAHVTHLDASKTSVSWARENATEGGLKDHPIRWIVDDVKDFVEREVRREKSYHGIILDPPSFGRGSKSQLWKIEDHLIPLMRDLKELLIPGEKSFVLLSSHSPGYTPTSLKNLLEGVFGPGAFSANEMCIFEEDGRPLPSGASCFWIKE